MNEQNENKNTELEPEMEEREEKINVTEDVQKSEEENNALLQNKRKADLAENIDFEKEGKNSSKEDGGSEEDFLKTSSSEEARECSYSYEPPYDTPFSAKTLSDGKGKKSNNGTKGLIALLIAITIVLTFIAGAVAGQMFLRSQNDFTTLSEGSSHGLMVHSTFSEVVEEVADSVVEVEGSGSGVIIDRRGYIITNEHVVSDLNSAGKQIVVVLHNGKRCVAKYQGGDAKYDIAVLKIDAGSLTLPVAKIGKSSALKVGDEVLAIGNPLATLGGTVTNGIISAKDRQIRVEHYLMTLLQTNAEINPGNSGGGLFNMAGELVGIVNAKQFATGIEGLGFAIPIDLAWTYAKDIIQDGYVKGKPYIGISFVEPMEGGVYITTSTNEVLKVNDQILSVNGKSVKRINDLYEVTDNMKIGDILEMKVKRKIGYSYETLTLAVKVIEYKP